MTHEHMGYAQTAAHQSRMDKLAEELAGLYKSNQEKEEGLRYPSNSKTCA